MQPRNIARLARTLIEDKQGEDPLILDIARQTSVASYFVITHGNSAPHVRALVDHLMTSFKQKKIPLYHAEGMENGEWALLDYGDVIIHVFHRTKREFYHLESLWGEARVVK